MTSEVTESTLGAESAYLDADDLALIDMLRSKNLNAAELQAVIDDIQREAFKRNRKSLTDKPPQRFDISTLSSTPREKPPGWDESMARVKQGLEKSKLEAPIYGTATDTSPFYASEKKEEAERKRVEEWRQRKEVEIALMRENRIKREIDEYASAKTLQQKKAAMERLSPEALARVANRGNG